MHGETKEATEREVVSWAKEGWRSEPKRGQAGCIGVQAQGDEASQGSEAVQGKGGKCCRGTEQSVRREFR
jgi:hypothetical protein